MRIGQASGAIPRRAPAIIGFCDCGSGAVLRYVAVESSLPKLIVVCPTKLDCYIFQPRHLSG